MTATRTRIKASTLGDQLLVRILAGVWMTNAIMFYIAGIWTFRLFQPLKVFQ